MVIPKEKDETLWSSGDSENCQKIMMFPYIFHIEDFFMFLSSQWTKHERREEGRIWESYAQNTEFSGLRWLSNALR